MTPRQTVFVAGIAAVVVVGAVLVAIVRGDDGADGAVPPAPQITNPPARPTPGPTQSLPPGVVPDLWPVDETRARFVAGTFAVAFSTYLPSGPQSPGEWLNSIVPFSTQTFVDFARTDFNRYWWYLTSGGLGAANAWVVSITPVWQQTESIQLRVVVDREVKSFQGNENLTYRERVSWDITLVGATKGAPKVVGCVKTDPLLDTELREGEPANVE